MVCVRTFISAEQASHMLGHRCERRGLPLPHVLVEFRRPPYRLARIVDDEVETVTRVEQLPAEHLDARRVPEVEPEYLETIAPFGEVGLARISRCGIAREACCHD